MEHRNGQREVHQRVVFRVLRVVGDRFDIGGQLLFAPAAHEDGVDDQKQNDPAFGHGEGVHIEVVDLEKQGRRSEGHEKDHIQSRAGLGKAFEVVVHRCSSPFFRLKAG